ncbi:unnamed protein product [Didymodactylos carnosus]|uniref:Uncharacterized protein n=1 Tax=Didymodactylos carnosus TaxID=1234261 RepID=A0A815V847_9BILA|nr:unnamed protein product [Didymodactylos carnosus]CAF1532477.1 unnamed protein product [Didymodactylos carnosus]CAF4217415.1 unnamed protein product [Didymodactylos carnosus]CAF4391823.1 unnamed protein product [Didymodactylos carnosus]
MRISNHLTDDGIKVVNDILLSEHIHTVSEPATSPHENYRTKYRVCTKIGKAKGLFRTGGKDTQVYLKLFDDKEAAEDLHLKKSMENEHPIKEAQTISNKAPLYVYLCITDENDQKLEDILLKYSRHDDNHGKPFHSGYIDIYDNIRSQTCLGNIKKLELWHDS